MSKHFVLAFAATVALVSACEKARADEIWITPGALSQHERAGFQQTNKGVGIEYRRGDLGAMVGGYDNSIHHTTHYALGIYQPWNVGPVRLGAAAGLVDGYRIREGRPFPVLLPMASTSIWRVGVNLTVIPPAEKSAGWVAAVQLKFRLD